MKRRLALGAICLALALISVGCARRGPTIEMGPDAEITHDGLHRIDRTRRLQRVWVKPDLDLRSYSKLRPIDAGVHYRRPPNEHRGEWPLNEAQTTFVREGLRNAMQRELERQGDWEFVTESGPDVLVIRGAIIDLVVTASGGDVGRNRSYGRSVGQATLVIELFDSESLEILARIADRREISRDTSSWRDDPITNRAAATRTFRDWARRFARALADVRTSGLPFQQTSEEAN
jgi:hypothetical protein